MSYQKIKFQDWECNIITKRYNNGRLAIELVEAESGEPVTVATVNLPDASLEEGEVFIKNWSENEGIMDTLIKANVIGPVIGIKHTGFVKATKHKLLI